MNVLVLGAWVISERLAEDLVSAYLEPRFDHIPRHLRRVQNVEANENIDWRVYEKAA
jgi:ribose 5-phosphate isomerase RpiB